MNALALHATAQTAAPIVPIFSGARVELATSPRNSGPFEIDDYDDPEPVFVMVAEIAPCTYAIVARDNHHAREGRFEFRSDAPRRSAFMYEVNEQLSIASDEDSKIVSLKPEDYAVWYQFAFDHDLEFWGFLAALTHVRNLQATRQNIIDDQFLRLRQDFLDLFRPQVAPYNDPKTLQQMRLKEQRDEEGAAEDERAVLMTGGFY